MWAESDGNFSPRRKHAPQNGHPTLALRPVTVGESGPSAAARTPDVGGGTSNLDFYVKYLNF